MDVPAGHPLPGAITIEHEGDRTVLCLRGELDSAVVEWFRTAHGRAPVLVDAIDAAAVSFICSTALALMLRCVEDSRAADRHPVLRASSPSVDRLLQLAGLRNAFDRGLAPSDLGRRG
jgi:anti-anti-sigma factor